MGINYLGRNVGEGRVEGCRGLASAFKRRLVIDLTLELYQQAERELEVRIVRFGGELRLMVPERGESFVGRLWPTSVPPDVRSQVGNSYKTRVPLEAELANDTIEALEDVRCGLGLKLVVQWWAEISGSKGPATVQETLTHDVKQSDWIDVLEQLGLGRRILLEVEPIDVKADDELATAHGHLVAAHAKLLRGAWRDCVGQCRDVLEAIGLGLKETKDNDLPWSTLGSIQREMDRPTRLRVARKAIMLLMHPSRHVDDVTVQMAWDREDAVCVLGMVVAAFNYVHAIRRLES